MQVHNVIPVVKITVLTAVDGWTTMTKQNAVRKSTTKIMLHLRTFSALNS
jgi:hypothetical protein